MTIAQIQAWTARLIEDGLTPDAEIDLYVEDYDGCINTAEVVQVAFAASKNRCRVVLSTEQPLPGASLESLKQF